MKTGQMLFVAFGGMMLGAAGTLAVQTGLMHYEVSLDVRPRGAVTLPPPALSSNAADPYLDPPTVHSWEPSLPSVESFPVTRPPLDDQQIAEIVSLREQIGHSASQKVHDLTASSEGSDTQAFAEHLRAAARSATLPQEESECPLCPAEGSPVARGLPNSPGAEIDAGSRP